MTTIDTDLQAIRDRLTPKQPDDATVLQHLQSEPQPVEPAEESTEVEPPEPAKTLSNRVYAGFMWLDRNLLIWMDTRSGQYIAYCFLAGILVWSISLLVPSQQRTSQALRQVYEYCKGE